MRLFSDRERDDLGDSGHSEGTYHYLNRSARPMAARVRAFWEDAFSDYPEDQQLDLKRRFTARRAEQHLGALVELFTFASLRRLGYEIEVHPTIAGTRAHPDFRALTPLGAILVECTTANPSEDATSAEVRRLEAFDALDRVESDQWSLAFEVEVTGARPVRSARFVRAVEEWVASLGPADARAASGGSLPKFVWNDEGWTIDLEAIPLIDGAELAGVAGIYGGQAAWVDAHLRVRGAVERKTDSYGDDLGEPLVLVVVPGVDFARDRHLQQALMGDRGFSIDVRTGEAHPYRERNGAWVGRTGLKGGRVSVVLYTPRLDAWRVSDTTWQLVHHPAPDYPAPQGLITFAPEVGWTAEGRGQETEAATTLAALFGLPDGWPGPED